MTLKDRLSPVFAIFRENAILRVIIESIQAEFDQLESDTEAVEDSLSIESATGQSLDLIADEFGNVGRRRGRSDSQFRQFLQGLEPAFDGRGTEQDVAVAVAAGVVESPADVNLRQDFTDRSYEIELFEFEAHASTTVRDLAELADPVSVDRVDPVHLFTDPARIVIATDDATVQRVSEDGLSTPTTGFFLSSDTAPDI
jgi:hypothetical protein